jgi:hypothetical protein
VRKKKPKKVHKNKRAFDATLDAYRGFASATVGGLSAVDPNRTASGSTPNLMKPTPLDFKADVERIVRTHVDRYYLFEQAYFFYDSDDVIDQERFADLVMGGGRPMMEQRLGEMFIRHGLYPTQKYFNTERIHS